MIYGNNINVFCCPPTVFHIVFTFVFLHIRMNVINFLASYSDMSLHLASVRCMFEYAETHTERQPAFGMCTRKAGAGQPIIRATLSGQNRQTI